MSREPLAASARVRRCARARAGAVVCRRLVAALTLAILTSSTPGCVEDMVVQPKVKTLAQSDFFKDGRASRDLVPGTVARGHLEDDEAFFTGKDMGSAVDTIPIPVTRALMLRGQERFGIHCAPCHGLDGQGRGMVVVHGFPQPPSYDREYLRTGPDGHFFFIITHGIGKMFGQKDKITPKDRWAIVAYIRALQLSRNARVSDLPPGVAPPPVNAGGR